MVDGSSTMPELGRRKPSEKGMNVTVDLRPGEHLLHMILILTPSDLLLTLRHTYCPPTKFC